MAVLLVGQFLVYAVAWAAGALMWREERPAILWWCAYCTLQALGLWLVMGQGSLTPPSAMLILLSYVAAGVGVDRFVQGWQQHRRHRPLWIGLLVLVELPQLLALVVPLPVVVRAIAYNLGVSLLLVAPIALMHRGLRREFGLWGLLPLLPGALVCLLALARSATLALHPELLLNAPSPLADNTGLLLATLTAAGAFNISFLGLVVARLVRRLHQQLDRDLLTGLCNRGGLEKQLATAWSASERHGLALSVAFIDVDHFKGINDAGGHEAGDRVLRAVAEALDQNARQTDLAGRWGGDEFMVLMPHTDEAAALQAMQRLRERVQRMRIEVPAGCPPVTLSIGIGARGPGVLSLRELVLAADVAMYRDKRGTAAAGLARAA